MGQVLQSDRLDSSSWGTTLSVGLGANLLHSKHRDASEPTVLSLSSCLPSDLLIVI